MNILVTGGCGFIGSNFIRQRPRGRRGSSRVVNLDKLTYAGNPANLADLAGDSRYVFVHGDIGDETLVGRVLSEHAIGAVVNFAAESHVDRSIDSPEPFVADKRPRDASPPERGEAPLGAAWPATRRGRSASSISRRTRCTARSPPARSGVHGGDRLRPQLPLRGLEGRERPPGAGLQHTYGLPTLTTNCSNNYGPTIFRRSFSRS